MSNDIADRVDEVSPNYKPAVFLSKMGKVLFWVIAVLNLSNLIVPQPLLIANDPYSILAAAAISLSIVYFLSTLSVALYFLPSAEKVRRRQMLSNAFDTNLTKEKTHRYYNNNFAAGLDRLAGILMENSHFGRSITARMLVSSRLITASYLFAWIFLSGLSKESIEYLKWGTQIVFSGFVIANWASLELLHNRLDKIYDRLWDHYQSKQPSTADACKARILDILVDYETAKATARVLQSGKVFAKLNPKLSQEWEGIKAQLNVGETNEN